MGVVRRTNVTTFTWFSQIYNIGSLLALYGSDYACSYTVALFPGIIPNFVVLSTEKLAFQCATLLSRERGLGIQIMNLAVLCGDLQTILLSPFE